MESLKKILKWYKPVDVADKKQIYLTLVKDNSGDHIRIVYNQGYPLHGVPAINDVSFW